MSQLCALAFAHVHTKINKLLRARNLLPLFSPVSRVTCVDAPSPVHGGTCAIEAIHKLATVWCSCARLIRFTGNPFAVVATNSSISVDTHTLTHNGTGARTHEKLHPLCAPTQRSAEGAKEDVSWFYCCGSIEICSRAEQPIIWRVKSSNFVSSLHEKLIKLSWSSLFNTTSH